MSVKDDLHDLIDQLTDADAAEALQYLRWLAAEDETLTEEELEAVRVGQEEIARGEYVTLDDFKRSLVE